MQILVFMEHGNIMVNINAAKSHANISVYGTWEYNAEVGSGLFTIPIGFRVSDSYNLVL